MIGITVGITTRNRPLALERCVRSLARAGAIVDRLLVFDDASDEPVSGLVSRVVPAGLQATVLRDEHHVGNIVGRNRLMRESTTPYVLLLDDDAVVLPGEAITRAIALLDSDTAVAAVAFAQAEADGSAWPAKMQPGRGSTPACVTAFIGFAHLLRREVFLQLGGYRESLVFYGEEKDFCLRLLNSGWRTVYLPDALVAHIPDPAGRSASRYVRFVIRNDCLYSLYNEPWPLAAVSLPVRLLRYRRMTAKDRGAHSGGLTWILRELWRSWPDVRHSRNAVSWSTIREWRRLSRTIVPYRPPALLESRRNCH